MRSAAALLGVDPKTVARYVAIRDRGGDPLNRPRRPKLTDPFIDKIEELDFAALCHQFGVIRSRGAMGTSADNAAAESFNATMKRETPQGAKRWPGARQG